MGPEEAAEEVLKGPYEACSECQPGERGNLECGLCSGTGAVLRQRFIDACKKLGCDEVLYKHVNAVANARKRALDLIQERRLYDAVTKANEKAKLIQDDNERRQKELYRQMQQEYDARRLKR